MQISRMILFLLGSNVLGKTGYERKSLSPKQTAYVFVTNIGFHWDLDSEKEGVPY